MGRFVNPDNSAFQVALNSKIYVDKTGLLEYTNSVLGTTEAYIATVVRDGLANHTLPICLRHIIVKAATLGRCFQSLLLAKKKILQYI